MKPSTNHPKLQTARLVLRSLRMEDVDFIFKEWSDPAVTNYMHDEEPLKSQEQAEERLRLLQTLDNSATPTWWGIENKESGHLIGTCGYFGWDKQHRRAEIGYDLCADVWGQGLMPEALRALIQYGFEEMNLNRIEAMTHIENQRSQRVLTKLRFQLEGMLREYFCRYGIYNDQVQYSLLRREWML
jgi:ribosomal-protein-alanine N-acetyltransferase